MFDMTFKKEELFGYAVAAMIALYALVVTHADMMVVGIIIILVGIDVLGRVRAAMGLDVLPEPVEDTDADEPEEDAAPKGYITHKEAEKKFRSGMQMLQEHLAAGATLGMNDKGVPHLSLPNGTIYKLTLSRAKVVFKPAQPPKLNNAPVRQQRFMRDEPPGDYGYN